MIRRRDTADEWRQRYRDEVERSVRNDRTLDDIARVLDQRDGSYATVKHIRMILDVRGRP